MEFPHLWQTSESGWKMQVGRWEFWSIQSLKKQMNPGDLGKFHTPFPTARVESRHAGVWVKERDVQLLDSLGFGTTGPSLWGDNVAKGRRRVSRLQPPASLLQTLPHVQTHGPCWWCWMLQLLWEIQANPIIGVWKEKATQEWKALHHVQVIFKGWHCCFPRQQQARRQLVWAGDQGEAESYHLQPRWGCCLQ